MDQGHTMTKCVLRNQLEISQIPHNLFVPFAQIGHVKTAFLKDIPNNYRFGQMGRINFNKTCSRISKPPSKICQPAYFYLSELIFFVHLAMRDPVRKDKLFKHFMRDWDMNSGCNQGFKQPSCVRGTQSVFYFIITYYFFSLQWPIFDRKGVSIPTGC